jgi:hypothetical protein
LIIRARWLLEAAVAEGAGGEEVVLVGAVVVAVAAVAQELMAEGVEAEGQRRSGPPAVPPEQALLVGAAAQVDHIRSAILVDPAAPAEEEGQMGRLERHPYLPVVALAGRRVTILLVTPL